MIWNELGIGGAALIVPRALYAAAKREVGRPC